AYWRYGRNYSRGPGSGYRRKNDGKGWRGAPGPYPGRAWQAHRGRSSSNARTGRDAFKGRTTRSLIPAEDNPAPGSGDQEYRRPADLRPGPEDRYLCWKRCWQEYPDGDGGQKYRGRYQCYRPGRRER